MPTENLHAFTKSLRSFCAKLGLKVSTWSGASKRTPNLVKVHTTPRPTVLYVKGKSTSPGFWGLNESQLASLRNADVNWLVVLLVGNAEDGYLLSSARVEAAIGSGRWTISAADWKVHEGPELQGEARFQTFENVFALVLPSLSPLAADIGMSSAARVGYEVTYRILRDTKVARDVKAAARYRCRFCGETITLTNGQLYAEAHHVRPLGAPHFGPDVTENVVCLCPKHHVLMDYGVVRLEGTLAVGIATEHVKYHNEVIYAAGGSA